MKKIVAIAAGGDSAEAEISFLSAQTVYDNLDRSIYEPIIVSMTMGYWNALLNGNKYQIDKNDFSFEFDGNRIRFDYVFIAIHGTPGEDGKLQAYFDLLKIPYSSPDHVGAALTFNKWYCNTLLRQLGYSVAKSIFIRKGERFDEKAIIENLKLPCFVKPCSCGSSYGVSKVKYAEDLLMAITKAFEFDHEIMIEEYLPGKELTCGGYRKEGKSMALPITQIIPNGEFFDFNAKYKGDSREITPARISEEATANIQTITRGIYNKLNMRGVFRADFMLVEDKPYIIELNAVPGLSAASLIPQQVRAAGMSLGEFFNIIIQETIKRK
ncbi:MAG: D-alanine--D-alanine ligase [Bacteroidetes bacterium]|nr:MAG: D-alanine--D-alanine ligase [Bacteroidota bacterium]MBL1145216.1 D-alanine--D-alanine ligase [Bacteroidota bacterium]MCB0803620.1 D-alanine--D-alanine ligase [Flavobacteriales bacterium]NOG58012.1 D-alanine--D-alanine ligase [Bacteroidota bacterium]